jgi:hypothetical protein
VRARLAGIVAGLRRRIRGAIIENRAARHADVVFLANELRALEAEVRALEVNVVQGIDALQDDRPPPGWISGVSWVAADRTGRSVSYNTATGLWGHWDGKDWFNDVAATPRGACEMSDAHRAARAS